MPAVTPADVHSEPSRTKIGSASTSIAGMRARELLRGGPVRSRAAAVEQAGRGEQERAGADRCRAPGPPRGADDPVEQSPIGCRLGVARAAGDDQRVERLAAASAIAASGVMVRPLEVRSGEPSTS